MGGREGEGGRGRESEGERAEGGGGVPAPSSGTSPPSPGSAAAPAAPAQRHPQRLRGVGPREQRAARGRGEGPRTPHQAGRDEVVVRLRGIHISWGIHISLCLYIMILLFPFRAYARGRSAPAACARSGYCGVGVLCVAVLACCAWRRAQQRP